MSRQMTGAAAGCGAGCSTAVRESSERALFLTCYRRAVDAYNAQSISGLWERSHHSATIDDSVKAFGKELEIAENPMHVISARLKSKRSDWISGSTQSDKSFNTHFIRALKAADIELYKDVIKAAFGVSFLKSDEVVLYRGDKRSAKDIMRAGFQLHYGVSAQRDKRLAYTGFTLTQTRYGGSDDILTYDYGISTSRSFDYAKRYRGKKGSVYKIHFKAGALAQKRILAVDILASWPGENSHFHFANQKKEVNALEGIPSDCIESYWTPARGWVRNPDYTGGVTPVCDAASAAASEYRAGAKVRLHSYSCDIEVYKGERERYHLVFASESDAKACIKGEDLRSERNAANLKGVDASRYKHFGLFAVRLNEDQYKAMQSRHTEMPVLEAVKRAPKYS